MIDKEFEQMTADERNRYLRHILSEDHEITFTKVDGSERVMPCTLRTEAMPLREANEHHKTRLYNPEVLSVWCLDKDEWRSFKVMNVNSIKKL
ncbi:MAG: hypothetical protein EBU08_08335 [Micrococcales bacterium]|nr:hypothetical protein [Micrococcales bacterium]